MAPPSIRPALGDSRLRKEMPENNLRKIIAVALDGLSGSVNQCCVRHFHSASCFFFCTVHNNLHGAALQAFYSLAAALYWQTQASS